MNIMCLLTGGIPFLGLIVEYLGHMSFKSDYIETNFRHIFSVYAFLNIFLFSILLIMCIYYIKNKSILILFSFLIFFLYAIASMF